MHNEKHWKAIEILAKLPNNKLMVAGSLGCLAVGFVMICFAMFGHDPSLNGIYLLLLGALNLVVQRTVQPLAAGLIDLREQMEKPDSE